MKMKKLSGFVMFLCMISGVFAQQVNMYKYVIIPKKFETLNDTNQYQLNVMTKQLFKEAGFNPVYDDALPDDLQRDNCLGLHADLIKGSGMFTTKLRITLRDCKNDVVFTSVEGRSKKKDFEAAYKDALRKTFKSIKALRYAYKPVAEVQPEQTEMQPVTTSTEAPVRKIPPEAAAGVLYAQPVAQGFQLVDSTPKIIFILQNTALREVYIIKDRNGILYKKDGAWIAEYYDGDALVRKTLSIRF